MWRQPNIVYRVKKGDTLFNIGRSYGVSVEELKQYNGLTSSELYIGQELLIPVSVYTVKPQDSLYIIAEKFNTTVKSLVILNNLSSTNLDIGQVLQIPLYTEAIVTSDVANIRREDSLNSEVLYKMVKGAKLPILKVQGQWYKVRLFNGKEAFVSSAATDFKTYGTMKPVSGIDGFYTLAEGPALPSSYNSFINNINSLSEIGTFIFRIDENNATQIENFGQFKDEEVNNLVNIAHKNNVKILALVHNLLYKNGGVNLAKDLVKELVSTKENRAI